MKKRIMSAMLVITMFLISWNTIVSAHSSSQEGILMKTYMPKYGGYYIGGEEVGWSIDEGNHPYTNIVTYRFAPIDYYLTDADKQKVRTGASKWSGTATISEVDGNGMGTVTTYNDANDSATAMCTNFNTDSNGHWGYFYLKINKAKTQTATTYAHEFGHALGLNDLYNSSNKNKLMYGQSDRTVSSPTSLDIWGAKVITGQHTSHTWKYKYYDTISSGNRHVKYCGSCNGYAQIANCSYNSSNVCRLCGRGASTSSVIPGIQ